jgi:hypothetical protein
MHSCQPLDNARADLFVRQPRTLQNYISVLRVQGAALLEQISKRLIRPFCQTPAFEVMDPRFQRGQSYVEKDNHTALL